MVMTVLTVYMRAIGVNVSLKSMLGFYVNPLATILNFFVLLHIAINILLGLVNSFDTNYIFIFWYIYQLPCLVLLNAFYFFIMAYGHTSSSTTSSNVSGSYIGENNAKRENEFGVPTSYISCILLVFTSSVDADLDKMLDGVCCPLVCLSV